MSRWTEEELRFLRAKYPYHTEHEIAQWMNRTASAIATRAQKLKIKKVIDARYKREVWTKEKEEEFTLMYPNTSLNELASHFGISKYAVKAKAGAMRLNKTEEYMIEESRGRFSKGHEPWNKGQKGRSYPGCEKTWFQKGHVPNNYRPVGSTRVLDGYHQTKIADPGVWALTHREVYKKHHGEIPDGYRVVFKDGDRLNIHPSNLEAITPSEAMRRTRRTKEYAAKCLELDIYKRKKLLEEYPDLIELKQVQLLLSENLKQHERKRITKKDD